MKKIAVFLIILTMTGKNITSQKSFTDDFVYLCNNFENVHPNIFEHYSLVEYLNLKNNFYERTRKCETKADFYFLTKEFLAKFNDSHTNIVSEIENMTLLYPFSVIFLNKKFVIVASENELLLGQYITKINRIDIDSISLKIGKFISAEHSIARNMYLANFLNDPLYYVYSDIIDKNTQEIAITLSNDSTYTIYPKKPNEIEFDFDTALFSHPISAYIEKLFFYKIIPEKNIAYLQLNDMLDRATYIDDFYETYNYFQRLFRKKTLKEYKTYSLFTRVLNRMFLEMRNRNIENLVVDLRYNGGGNSTIGDQLLFFLLTNEQMQACKSSSVVSRISQQMCKKYRSVHKNYKKGKYGNISLGNLASIKKHSFVNQDILNPRSVFYIPDTIEKFKGNVYFIQGNNTYSSGSDLLLKIYDNNLFTTIGEPTAQSPNSFGDRFIFTLPYSKIECSVSWKYFIRPDTSNSSNILHPNVYIPFDYEALKKEKIDTALEWIFQDISNQ